MKRIVKIAGLFLAGIILITITASTITYNNYRAKDPDIKVIPANLNYYYNSYDKCRAAFRESAKQVSEKFKNVTISNISVLSHIDSDLTIDYCYIPAQKNTHKLLIINSGLHGIEGFTGSAIQLMFMKELLPKEELDNMGVLLIHGINPYGFKYHRKVTENNIDLNRNCVKDTDMFNSPNKGYEKLSDLLMPTGKVNCNSLRNKFFHLIAIKKIVKESMPVLRQAALQGQYNFDKGIYYGGKTNEPQIDSLKTLLQNVISDYKIVLNVDLHTAYGERGKLHMFLNPIEDKDVKNGIETVFKGFNIDWGSGEDFYTINGEYVGWAGSLSDSVLYLPMMFEYGTLNSQETFGSLKSIQIMINENQGAHYGFKSKKHAQKTKEMFREMYYPSSGVWRSKVILDTKEMMSTMLNNYHMFKSTI